MFHFNISVIIHVPFSFLSVRPEMSTSQTDCNVLAICLHLKIRCKFEDDCSQCEPDRHCCVPPGHLWNHHKSTQPLGNQLVTVITAVTKCEKKISAITRQLLIAPLLFYTSELLDIVGSSARDRKLETCLSSLLIIINNVWSICHRNLIQYFLSVWCP